MRVELDAGAVGADHAGDFFENGVGLTQRFAVVHKLGIEARQMLNGTARNHHLVEDGWIVTSRFIQHAVSLVGIAG